MRRYAQPQLILPISQKLGLTPVVALDVADPRSYDGSSQTWTDATGNGNNFFRGTDGTSESLDPTFAGAASDWHDTTYFSSDGGDIFKETAAHTFAANWHKNNGAFSIVAAVYLVNGSTGRFIFSNRPGTSANGIAFFVTSAEKVTLAHSYNNTPNSESLTTTAAVTVPGWNFIGCAYDEATTSASIIVNSTVENFTPTASTATNAASSNLRISGSDDSATNALESGERIALLSAFSSKLTDAQLTSIYTALKQRRFTSMP